MIEHLKSGLSISTHVGCTMKCSYCVLSSLNDFSNGPIHDAEPQCIVDALLSGKELFENGETPLIVNNRTDPMLPSVQADTCTLLDCLVNAQVTSPVLLISKFPPTQRMHAYFQKLPLMFIYSYSGLASDFNYKLLEEHLEKIVDIVPEKSRYHYYRPIIPGQNDDTAEILKLLETFERYKFSGSIMTGLRVTAQNQALIDSSTAYDPRHKLLQKGLYLDVLDQLTQNGRNYPVYRHTSCAVACFLKKRCKLGYFRRNDHCNLNCSNFRFCAEIPPRSQEWITAVMEARFGKNFDYRFDEDGLLEVYSPITQEQVAFLKNAFGIRVQANQIVLSPSERSILGYE